MQHINLIAAVVAGIIGYFPGGLWYSKAMFLRRWAAEMGIDFPLPVNGRRLNPRRTRPPYAKAVSAACLAGNAPAQAFSS